MIKIGIYDRYLSTMGGGERYSCKAAEILSKQQAYRVDLLTDLHVDLDKLSRQLHLDLSRVHLNLFPFISPDYAQKITTQYDLFINATYLSALPAYGARNLYLCYFPTPFDVDLGALHRFLLLFRPLARGVLALAQTWCQNFEGIDIVQGLYEPQRFMLGRGSWSSGQAQLRFLGPVIRLGFKNPASSGLQKMQVAVDAWEGSRHTHSQKLEIASGRLEAAGIPYRGRPVKVCVQSDTFTAQGKDSRKLGAVLYEMSKKNIFKKWLLKAVGYIPQFVLSYPRDLGFLQTYQGIVAISRYSQQWICKLWKKESILLFPPVDTPAFTAKPKKKIILTVGRFFPEHHNKKQREMAAVFRGLCRSQPQVMEGYSLYMAGGLSDKKEHVQYVQQIQKESEGYPITLLPNISYADLKELFSVAEIFWHAAGMGEDEQKHPEKFEHFGITTVEAMAAGCIPVVINKGGQKEIIREGIDGFLFEDTAQLKEMTVQIIKGQHDTKAIQSRALARAELFSSKNFAKKLNQIVKAELKNHGFEHHHR